eukprot:1178991-Prorocentrum_minimum.AAC.2
MSGRSRFMNLSIPTVSSEPFGTTNSTANSATTSVLQRAVGNIPIEGLRLVRRWGIFLSRGCDWRSFGRAKTPKTGGLGADRSDCCEGWGIPYQLRHILITLLQTGLPNCKNPRL